MSEDHLGALPKLYNAPAYARPPRPMVTERPFDPDDLPLEVYRSAHDHAFLASMVGDADHRDGGGSIANARSAGPGPF